MEQGKSNLNKNKRIITKSKLREYRDAFSLFDKDGNGYLTKEELGHVMHKVKNIVRKNKSNWWLINKTQLGQWARIDELQEMLSFVDTDGDGTVSFEEFVEILLNITDSEQSDSSSEEQELRDAFRVFDKHNRGYITSSDLRTVLQCLGRVVWFLARQFSSWKFFYLPMHTINIYVCHVGESLDEEESKISKIKLKDFLEGYFFEVLILWLHPTHFIISTFFNQNFYFLLL